MHLTCLLWKVAKFVVSKCPVNFHEYFLLCTTGDCDIRILLYMGLYHIRCSNAAMCMSITITLFKFIHGFNAVCSHPTELLCLFSQLFKWPSPTWPRQRQPPLRVSPGQLATPSATPSLCPTPPKMAPSMSPNLPTVTPPTLWPPSNPAPLTGLSWKLWGREMEQMDRARAKVMWNFTTESEECCSLKFSQRTWVAETVSIVYSNSLPHLYYLHNTNMYRCCTFWNHHFKNNYSFSIQT